MGQLAAPGCFALAVFYLFHSLSLSDSPNECMFLSPDLTPSFADSFSCSGLLPLCVSLTLNRCELSLYYFSMLSISPTCPRAGSSCYQNNSWIEVSQRGQEWSHIIQEHENARWTALAKSCNTVCSEHPNRRKQSTRFLAFSEPLTHDFISGIQLKPSYRFITICFT